MTPPSRPSPPPPARQCTAMRRRCAHTRGIGIAAAKECPHALDDAATDVTNDRVLQTHAGQNVGALPEEIESGAHECDAPPPSPALEAFSRPPRCTGPSSAGPQ